MGKVTGFLETARAKHPARPVGDRLHDWREVYVPFGRDALVTQDRSLLTLADLHFAWPAPEIVYCPQRSA